MNIWRELNLRNMPIPRPIWIFEGTEVQVGVQVSDGNSDSVAALSVEFDLGHRKAAYLNRFLLWAGAMICRIIGHDYEAVSYAPNTPENPRDHLWFGDIEQCRRCCDTRPQEKK